jgi:hypothetical protein
VSKSKTAVSLPLAGGRRRTVLPLLALALVLALVIKDPHGAAVMARAVGRGIGHVITALTTFAHTVGS